SDTRNIVVLYQNGNINNASSSQSGGYQLATLSQYGSNNTIVGTQAGGGNSPALGNSAIVTQGAEAARSNGNAATYSQSGAGHSLT
ncbi:hypothetical protein ABTM23_19510, partial [Acinetobacter baumannii]